MPNISRFLQAQRFALEGAPPDIRTAAIPPLRPFGQCPATHTNPLEGFRPAHPTSPKGQTLNGKRYRTDRVLPKPDISPATYTWRPEASPPQRDHAIYIRPMTRLLEEAVATVASLPDEQQDDFARILLQLAGHEQPVHVLTPEEEADLDASIEAEKRGDFATDEEMNAIRTKYAR